MRKLNGRKRSENDRRTKITRAAIVLAVAASAVGAYAVTRPKQPTSMESLEGQELEHSLGTADALVTIVEFSDFNCPTCKVYHELGIIDQVLEDFDGEVRFVVRHFPVITPDSPKLAEAAECASDQGAFWDYYDLLYQESPSRAGEVLDFAVRLGLDPSEFESCLDSGKYASLVAEQMNQAFDHRFRGTPAFLINGTPLLGPPTYPLLVTLLEEALAQAQQ